jgi:very-short-patch-repair endonuclease
MGAWVIVVPFVRNTRKYPLTIIVSRGWYRRHRIEREVAVWGYAIDFANRRHKLGIEIDGRGYHMDVVADQERDEHLRKYGWRIKRIVAARLWKEPQKVRADVIRFIGK